MSVRVGEAAPTAASSPIPDRGILLLGERGGRGGNWKQWVASHSQVGMLPTKNSCRYPSARDPGLLPEKISEGEILE